jgi:hypothetical protein
VPLCNLYESQDRALLVRSVLSWVIVAGDGPAEEQVFWLFCRKKLKRVGRE